VSWWMSSSTPPLTSRIWWSPSRTKRLVSLSLPKNKLSCSFWQLFACLFKETERIGRHVRHVRWLSPAKYHLRGAVPTEPDSRGCQEGLHQQPLCQASSPGSGVPPNLLHEHLWKIFWDWLSGFPESPQLQDSHQVFFFFFFFLIFFLL